ncbi:MAG: SCO family protein [Proteobacteria bacterium]|nr:SCO family protein [Pseudomonadota bacterium]
MKPIRATVALCLVFVAIILVAFVYSVVRTPVLTLAQLSEAGVFVFPEPRPLKPFALQTDGEAPFANEGFVGKWSFVFFGFTNCPGPCPTTMSVLGQADRQLEENAKAGEGRELWQDFQVFMVSVDPERDDFDRLGSFVRGFSERFVGLRGSRASVAQLSSQLGIGFGNVPAGVDGYEVEHSAQLVVIDPEGHYHAFIKPPHTVEQVTATYRALNAAY